MMMDASLTACHDMRQTLMAVAIHSVELGLRLLPLIVVYMMIDASLTACHDNFQTPMTSAISA